MGRPALEVADIFRAHGPAWRQSQHGHLSLGQLQVMSAIEQCRSAALGGHVLRCDACAAGADRLQLLRNRHCPKCRRARRAGHSTRQADLSSSITTSSSPCGTDRASPISTRRYSTTCVRGRRGNPAHHAVDPKHLGAQVGSPWSCIPGLALTPHPHVHRVSPAGGCLRTEKAGFPVDRLLPAGAGAIVAVPAAFPRRTRCRASRRQAAVSSAGTGD